MPKTFQRRRPTEQEGMIRLSFSLTVTAVHSLLLGIYIFFQTEKFYEFFFGVAVENLFFVKQAGLFLFCMGLFYVVPLLHLKSHKNTINIIILTKILAVVFLLFNFHLVPKAAAILTAALIDALFAMVLIWNSHTAGLLLRRKMCVTNNNKKP